MLLLAVIGSLFPRRSAVLNRFVLDSCTLSEAVLHPAAESKQSTVFLTPSLNRNVSFLFKTSGFITYFYSTTLYT